MKQLKNLKSKHTYFLQYFIKFLIPYKCKAMIFNCDQVKSTLKTVLFARGCCSPDNELC